MTDHVTLYRKTPDYVRAMQFTGTGQSHADIETWADDLIRHGLAEHPRGNGSVFTGDAYGLYIDTLDGRLRAMLGDWVVCGVHGTFFPCKPAHFAETYTVAVEEAKLEARFGRPTGDRMSRVDTV